MSRTRTTIAAIASPPGESRRGLIRLSGAEARGLIEAVWSEGAPPAERCVQRGSFHDGTGEQPGLLVWMPGPRSFTREDVAEFHLPGSPYLLQAALARLLEVGAQLAEPGEFTRRAFENGRIDLARAEGILELIEATSRAERRSATALLFGGLSRRIRALRDELEDLRALCEASLDFDQDDTGHVESSELDALFDGLHDKVLEARSWESRRAVGQGLPRVVLAGLPNAGKSSLFNVLAGEQAIVSGEAGTTRDVLRGTWTLDSLRCELIDIAGFESSSRASGTRRGQLEREAQERGLQAFESADLVLWVMDSALPGQPPSGFRGIQVLAKSDLVGPDSSGAAGRAAPEGPRVPISSRTGAGLTELARLVEQQLAPPETGEGGGAAGARELSVRHRESLDRALAQLEEGRALWTAGAPLEVFAEHLREATSALDGITGLTTPEDLLDRIFGRFCLGK